MSSSNQQKFLPIQAPTELKQKRKNVKIKRNKEPKVIIQKDHIFVNSKYVCKCPLEEMYRVVIPNTKIKYAFPLYAVDGRSAREGYLISTNALSRGELEEFEKYAKNKYTNE